MSATGTVACGGELVREVELIVKCRYWVYREVRVVDVVHLST